MKTHIILACSMLILISFDGFAIDPEAIVGLWPLDEGEGNTVADLSGNGHDGNIVGTPKWVGGKFGEALEFNVASDRVLIPHAEELTLMTFTVMAWVKVPALTGGWQKIVGKDAWPPRCYVLELRDTNGVPLVSYGNNAACLLDARTPAVDDQWHHLAGTYDGIELKIYVDGAIEGQRAKNGEPDPVTNEVYIGGAGAGNNIVGAVDDVGIFNQALEEEEIKEIMDKGLRMFVTAVEPSGKLATTWGSMKW